MEDLRADGRSLIFITHKLDEALTIADDVTVLRDGKAVGTVAATETSEQELAQMMVGRNVLFDREPRESTPGKPIFDAEGLRVTGDRGLERVSDVDLSVRQGKSSVSQASKGTDRRNPVEALTGLRAPDSGVVRFEGEDVTSMPRRDRIEAGIAYVPEDRHVEGLVMDYDPAGTGCSGTRPLNRSRSAGSSTGTQFATTPRRSSRSSTSSRRTRTPRRSPSRAGTSRSLSSAGRSAMSRTCWSPRTRPAESTSARSSLSTTA